MKVSSFSGFFCCSIIRYSQLMFLVDVDDALHIKDLDHVEKKHDIEQISAKVMQTKYSVFIQDYGPMTEAPKVRLEKNGKIRNARMKDILELDSLLKDLLK